ncbi:MAG: thiol peroxidase [Acidimicrobiales bacterium]
MATITLRGNPIKTSGELPAVGSAAPAFTLTKGDLSELSSADLAGKRVVLNIFPSIDTGSAPRACARSTSAAELSDTVVLCVSADLPFAGNRFCGAEGIENVQTASTFRHPEFLADYGVRIEEGGMAGLAARAVVVIDEAGKVAYTELVPEIAQEPSYDGALGAL